MSYGGCPLSVVIGLHSPEEWDSIPRLTLQLPEPNQLRNELRLLVQTDTSDDAIEPSDKREREREREM